MEKELDRLIGIYGIDVLRSYLGQKKSDEKHEDYKRNWNLNCRRYGLKPEDLGVRFVIDGKMYITTGIKTANRKYPLLADRVMDGKGFKFPPNTFFAAQKIEQMKKSLLDEVAS